jgi:teichuronic acid biosynthesis glycosyltransferase TuaG
MNFNQKQIMNTGYPAKDDESITRIAGVSDSGDGGITQGDAPRISVIVPALNADAHLARAVASVQAQTRHDWELIIADDGSRDGTLALAASLAKADPRIKVLPRAKTALPGAGAARNRAIETAQGRYLAFLDADDEWLPDKLATQVGRMEAKGLALAYTGFWRDRGTRRYEVKVPAQVTRAALLRGNVMGTLTVVCDREQLGKIAFPDLSLRQDYALWLDLLRRTERAQAIRAPLSVAHVTPGSLSSNRWRAVRATWRMYRDYAGLGRLAAAGCLASHLTRRLWRG